MRALAIAAIVSIPALVAAAPVAQQSADIYGSGTPVDVSVTDTGDLVIAGAGGAAAQRVHVADGPVTAAKLTAGMLGGKPAIVVVIGTAEHGDAIVVGLDGTTWRVITHTDVGGVGLDADYARELAILPIGIVRYQTRGDITRCDGKPARLFPEGWDGQRFRPLVPTHIDELDPNAPTLTAALDTVPASAAPAVFQATSASAESGADDAGALGAPNELDDGDLATVWRHPDGRGQFFTFVARVGGSPAEQLRIVPGDPHGNPNAARPKRLAIVGAKGTWWVDVPVDKKAPRDTAYVVTLPADLGECVTVFVTDSTAPTEMAIAELEIYSAHERTAGAGPQALAHAVALDQPGAANAATALAHRGAAGVTAIEAELGVSKTPDARRNLVRALTTIAAPEAVPTLTLAAAEGWVRGVDLLAVIAALGALDAVTPLHDLAARADLDADARVAAAAAIRPTTQAGVAALADLAGTGSRAFRHAVIESLAGAPLAGLVDAANDQADARAAGDLWRAVSRHARAATTPPAERAAAVTAMLAALPRATDYERRYRLIEGLATLGDAAALTALDAALRALDAPVAGTRAAISSANAESSALREVAARGLASAPRVEAVPLAVELARDPNPGVRLDALSALAAIGVAAGADPTSGGPAGAWHGAPGADGVDRVIITALSTDAWPEVRRRAATALGSRCARPGPADALIAAIAKDAALTVRTDALDALVACKPADLATRLAAIWNDGKAPIELRGHAIDIAVELADPALGTALIARLAAWRGAALEDANALALAQHAAVAIGRLAPPGAAAALTAALADSAYPEIVASAADGLGALGPACPADAKAKLVQLGASDERQIAVAAKHAAALCGH